MDSQERLPLFALLSFALVAFTIEFDNEFEHQVPHRTTMQGSSTGSRQVPWLVSRVMWSNFLRFIPEEGTTLGDLRRRLGMRNANLRQWLERTGKWWGYLVVESKSPEARILPTAGGRKAIQVWRTLDDLIEKRWRDRFGEEVIDALCHSLSAIVRHIKVELPEGLPVLGYGLYSRGPEEPQPAEAPSAGISLPSLLSKVLLWFAMEIEGSSEVSLAICANVLRLVGEEGIRVRDLPRQAGVSREAIAMAVSFLLKRGYAVQESKPGTRTKIMLLTAQGRKARKTYDDLVQAIEQRWHEQFGDEVVGRLRESLERLAGNSSAEHSPLRPGLHPDPEGWRKAAPEALPYYPMVLHRGGFPDGS
ncbi:MAG TPA: MarR family winged helix-turn-helix transcriptional regulator [Acidobacteriaceae bacterium]|nr:MarR family winged helix-turn-helix transcriptional regulator [Acidobacteriaceae bacterium]